MKPWNLASWPRSAWAVLTVVLVALLTLLGGGGKSLTTAYKSFTETDRIMEMSAALSGPPAQSFPVTLIKVDDETMSRWGKNHAITPHAAVARLIEIAAKGGALAIVVDIDLASENRAVAPSHALMEAVADYQPNALPLMFVRNFGAGPANEGVDSGTLNATPYDYGFAASQRAMWVSALTPLSGDRIVRRLRLWQTICDGGGGVSYPSPALVIAAKFSADGDRSGELEKFLAGQVDRYCKKMRNIEPEASWPHRLNPDVAIRYMFNAAANEGNVKTVSYKGASVALLQQIPAWTLVNVSDNSATLAGDIHPQAFQNRVVVIGVTHSNSGDLYETPLGAQPGAMILANSIAAAADMANMRETSPTTEILIVLGIFAVLAFVSYRLQMAPAALIAVAIIVAAAVILSRLFNFDVAIRVIAATITLFVLHKFVDSLVGVIYDWSHGKGWRSILKTH